jgi:hypothetical protein
MRISFLAWVPIGLVAVRFLGDLASIVIPSHLAVFVVSSLMTTHFRCPHCQERFASRGLVGAFGRCCVHCGIRSGTPRSAIVAKTTGDVAPDAESE